MAKIKAEHVKRDWEIELSDEELGMVIHALDEFQVSGPYAQLANRLNTDKMSWEGCC